MLFSKLRSLMSSDKSYSPDKHLVLQHRWFSKNQTTIPVTGASDWNCCQFNKKPSSVTAWEISGISFTERVGPLDTPFHRLYKKMKATTANLALIRLGFITNIILSLFFLSFFVFASFFLFFLGREHYFLFRTAGHYLHVPRIPQVRRKEDQRKREHTSHNLATWKPDYTSESPVFGTDAS